MTTPAPEHALPAVPAPPKRKRRWLRWVVALLLVAMVSTELVARFYIGLGDPPLMMADPEIEYLFQPNQTVRRLHHLIHYNAYSQRADDYPASKSSSDELRILVVGDSVINGGVQTDQTELATSIIQRELAAKLSRPMVVGNVSAGGWGPPNELAYLKKFGLFNADILVIELSSHDYADVHHAATQVGIAPDMPDRKPLCATSELIFRYAIPMLKSKLGMKSDAPSSEAAPKNLAPGEANPRDIAQCLDDIRQMIELGKKAGARVIVVQHLERKEVEGHMLLPGHDLIAQASFKAGAEVWQTGRRFIESSTSGHDPFRDIIHPNALGQRLLAETIEEAVLDSSASSAATLPIGGN